MAIKMKSQEPLRDEFLEKLVRADEPVPVPTGMLDTIMDRIGTFAETERPAPYRAPKWLKWGIPATILSSLIIMIVWNFNSLMKEPAGLASLNALLGRISSWISGLNPGKPIGHFDLSGPTAWILGGCMGLAGGFLLIGWFLERKTGH